MKIDMNIIIYGKVFISTIKKGIGDKNKVKAIKKEYKNIMERASDIGNKNMLLSSYALCAVFIAMNRVTGMSLEDNYKILNNGLKKSKLLKMALGNAENYLSKKRCNGRVKWSEETKKRIYKNDWVVEIAPEDPSYDYGLDYLECGVCKLCRDLNCFEYAKYLCKLDFMLAEIIGLKLTRTQTLAEGGTKCDFRYHKIPKN